MKEIIDNETFYGPVASKRDKSQDQNAEWVSSKSNIVYRNCVFDARFGAEALKIRKSRNITLENCTYIGGFEDCIDILYCENIRIIGGKGIVSSYQMNDVTGIPTIVRAKQFMTCKGGTDGMFISDFHIFGIPATGTLFDFGQHVKKEIREANHGKGREPQTQHLQLSRVLFHGKQEGVDKHSKTISLSRTWNSSLPVITDCHGKYMTENLCVPFLVWNSYFALRDMGVL